MTATLPSAGASGSRGPRLPIESFSGTTKLTVELEPSTKSAAESVVVFEVWDGGRAIARFETDVAEFSAAAAEIVALSWGRVIDDGSNRW